MTEHEQLYGWRTKWRWPWQATLSWRHQRTPNEVFSGLWRMETRRRAGYVYGLDGQPLSRPLVRASRPLSDQHYPMLKA